MNMPGSFLIELAAMHLYGPGDLAWRLFDFTLLFAASAAFFSIINSLAASSLETSPPQIGPSNGWYQKLQLYFPAIFAASLFILIHGRDGLAEGGQRDLTMAVCLLGATACLFRALPNADAPSARRNPSLLASAGFGLLSGIALTIKPTAILLTLAQLALACAQLPRIRALRLALVSSVAALVAPAIAFAFLLRERALHAFLAGLRGIVPYYASLGHRPLGFVVVHSISPLLPLVVVWIILELARFTPPSSRPHLFRDWRRNALLAGFLFGLVNCIVQQRALPYYRYPLLVFLLPLLALDLTCALNARAPYLAGMGTVSQLRRALALIALGYSGVILAPQSAVLIHRYQWWNLDFINSLEQNLESLGGSSLSGRVQCIDSISGCGNVLYRLRLEPSTGVLSDFLLFGAVSDHQPPDQIPVLRDTRALFLAAITAHPPQVIIVTSHLHIDGPDNFQKLARFPAFANLLATRYTLRTQWHPTRNARWWSREETPASYRIYVLNP